MSTAAKSVGERSDPKTAGWLYSFFYPNSAHKYNEDQRKLKRKDDDVKLHRIYKLNFDIENRDFLSACRTGTYATPLQPLQSVNHYVLYTQILTPNSPNNLVIIIPHTYIQL